MTLTVSDFFAGAGGSSTGMVLIPGVQVIQAANHWQLACDVHNLNHPNTDHAAVDLHKENPAFFKPTDVGWFSPECTKWSQASGKQRPSIEEGLFEDPLSDEAATRSRLLMFDVLRYAEHHRYRVMVVENVVDIATQTKYANAWLVWRRQLRALGYTFRVVSLNSMHAQTFGTPAPQSRDRIYIVCWLAGTTAPDLDRILRPRAFCPRCQVMVESQQSWKGGSTVGKYRQQYVYVHGACGAIVEPGWLPAAVAIDWSIPGERIGDRKKSLTDKTLDRIAAGIARYWSPMHIEAAGNTYDAADPNHRSYGDPNAYYRAWPMDEALRALTTSSTRGLVIPVEGRDGKQALPMDMPLRTQTTRAETALAYAPFILDRRGEYRVRGLDDPLSTITANDTTKAIISEGMLPFVAELRGGRSDARSVSEPAATFTAGGNHHALVAPYFRTGNASPASDPMGTLTTHDRYALVHRNNGGGAEMTTPIEEVMRTLTTAGHQSLIQAGPRGGRPSVSPADLAAAREMVDDCYFRMFQPHEVAKGMAFPDGYEWQPNSNKKVSNRDLVKMAGNAVTPPAARDLMGVISESITGEAVAA
jgi:DNA (cytosine-5)-methyltransferase 1